MAEAEAGTRGTSLRIVPAGAAEIVRLGLLDELDAELAERYPGEPTNGVEVEGFEDSGGCFLLASVKGEPAGCGAFRRLDATSVEIKRMYVRRAHRGHGLAGELLVALEREALARGYSRVLLETGTRQPEAIALYRRHGYEPIEAFGPYVDLSFSVCFGKALHAA